MGAARLVHMFNATLIVIEAFIRELRTMYERTYTTMEPDYPGVTHRWEELPEARECGTLKIEVRTLRYERRFYTKRRRAA
jgi:hypothetical protein